MSEDFTGKIEEIGYKLAIHQRHFDELVGKCDMLSQQLDVHKKRSSLISHKQEVYSKSIEILDLAQKVSRVTMKDGFESIVTYALQFILGVGYKFELEFDRWGKYHEVNFNIKTDDFNLAFDPLDTSGGGTIDIVSLALRVAIMELHKPEICGPIILDESFKHLSRQHLFKAGEFLNALAERVGRQIIIVSHKSELVKMAHKAIEVK